MKKAISIIVVIIIIAVIASALNDSAKPGRGSQIASSTFVSITPVMHATLVLQWDDTAIYADPTGGAKAFEGKPKADVIIVTDIHGDHYSSSTLESVVANASANAVLIVPQAVKDLLPANIAVKATVLKNGDSISSHGLDIKAVPMYNYPETADSRHTKGRGNGYVIEKSGYTVYIAGDTAGTPEMRALKNIDMAFVPMNLPFTMGVEEAASAVLDFKPKRVYPYHYRGQNGLSDVAKFKQLVNAGNPNIDVQLLNWYPQI